MIEKIEKNNRKEKREVLNNKGHKGSKKPYDFKKAKAKKKIADKSRKINRKK